MLIKFHCEKENEDVIDDLVQYCGQKYYNKSPQKNSVVNNHGNLRIIKLPSSYMLASLVPFIVLIHDTIMFQTEDLTILVSPVSIPFQYFETLLVDILFSNCITVTSMSLDHVVSFPALAAVFDKPDPKELESRTFQYWDSTRPELCSFHHH